MNITLFFKKIGIRKKYKDYPPLNYCQSCKKYTDPIIRWDCGFCGSHNIIPVPYSTMILEDLKA